MAGTLLGWIHNRRDPPTNKRGAVVMRGDLHARLLDACGRTEIDAELQGRLACLRKSLHGADADVDSEELLEINARRRGSARIVAGVHCGPPWRVRGVRLVSCQVPASQLSERWRVLNAP